jgi:hypothetical protein
MILTLDFDREILLRKPIVWCGRFTNSSPVRRFPSDDSLFGDACNIELSSNNSRYPMSNRNTAALNLDRIHCRAICDEIGERLHYVLKPETSDIPPRLLALIEKLTELECAPSIVPSIDEMSFRPNPKPANRAKPSVDPVLHASNRLSVSACS